MGMLVNGKMKYSPLKWLLLSYLVFTLISCRSIDSHRISIGTVGKLPKKEIVFQGIVNAYSLPKQKGLGFVDSQGSVDYSEPDYFSAGMYPAYTSDNVVLVFGNATAYWSIYVDINGKLSLYDFQSRDFAVPNRITPIDNTHEAIIVTMDSGGAPEEIPYSLRRLDLDSGKVLKTYLTTHPDRKSVTYLEIGTRALDGQELLFVRWDGNPRRYALVLLNTESQQETILLDSTTQLSAPAFSPDGHWIAYGDVDGLYVLNRDAPEEPPRKIVAAVSAERAPLAPSWSPDGQWLVYHDCLRDCGEDITGAIDAFTIFKVNAETGEATQLVEGGINPFWRSLSIDSEE